MVCLFECGCLFILDLDYQRDEVVVVGVIPEIDMEIAVGLLHSFEVAVG